MRKINVVAFTAIMILSVMWMPLSMGFYQDNAANSIPVVEPMTPHAPIRVNDNADFPGIAASGDGSAGSPWIIENYEINGTGVGYCIYVGNTTEHFIVRNCTLNSSSGVGSPVQYFGNTGLNFFNVAHGKAHNCTIFYNTEYGAYVSSSNNVTISKCNASYTAEAITFSDTVYSTIANCTMYGIADGVWFTQATRYNTVFNNTAVGGTSSGILLSHALCRNNTIINNTVSYCDEGIMLTNSDNNTVSGNIAHYCPGWDAIAVTNCLNTVIDNNTMDGNEVAISINDSDFTYIRDNSGVGNDVFIDLRNSDECDLIGNNASWCNQVGLSSGGLPSNHNVISNNEFWNNTMHGIYWTDGQDNEFSYNTASGNLQYSIYVSDDNNVLDNNTASYNTDGGFYIQSSGNTITNNTASDNPGDGMRFRFAAGSSNTVSVNDIANNNGHGLYLSGTNSNTIFHNNIINNAIQAFDDGVNAWDNGYPSGGNYWDDYAGADAMNGPLQDQTGPDGIGDTPYIIDGDSQDDYPLMTPGDKDDNYPPTSSVDVIAPYWQNVNPLAVTATASDIRGSVASIELWSSYEGGGYALFDTDNAAPWSWDFTWPNNEGNYTFYSIAFDDSGNTEAVPGVFDEDAGYDATVPTSSVDVITPYWHNETVLVVNATASDSMSGVASVELWTSFEGGNYTLFGTDNAAPWSWNFNWSSGEGEYTFYSRARDNAGNYEGVPGAFDEDAGYDNTTPTSSVDDIADYWQSASPLTVNVTAANDTSGIANVTLWFRFSADNSNWGIWLPFGTDDTAPYSWNFDFPEDDGYYEFFSMANDTYGYTEAMPASADTECVYDTTDPVITDHSPSTATTGDTYTFHVEVDDLTLDQVYIVHRFGSGTETNATLTERSGSHFWLNITVPLGSLDPLHYLVGAVDALSFVTETAQKNVMIVDNDPPTAYAGTDQNVNVGVNVTLNAMGSDDNIAVVNYTWTFTHNSSTITLYGVSPTFVFENPGNYNITLNVTDARDNSDEDVVQIRVAALPPDNDGDGIPDSQDDDDDNDGVPDATDDFPFDDTETTDTDGDGTGDNADTDDDGDGVADSADAFPLDATETLDTDGDGIGNNADTDDDGDGIPDTEDDEPLIPAVDTGFLTDYLWLIIIIIVVVVVALLALMMMGKGASKGPEEPGPDEGTPEADETSPEPEESTPEPEEPEGIEEAEEIV